MLSKFAGKKQQSKASDTDSLERFPDSILERYATTRQIPETDYTRGVLLWNTPMSMSQSHFGGRFHSDACGLIALKMAEYLTHYDVQFPYIGSKLYLGENAPKNTSSKIRSFPSYLPDDVLGVYVKAILEGNDLCDREKEIRKEEDFPGFHIKDAIKVTGFKMRLLGVSLQKTFKEFHSFLTGSINEMQKDNKVKDWPHIFFTLSAKQHCVLIVYQPKNRMFAFIDTLHHEDHRYLSWRNGGSLAISRRRDLPSFCRYVERMFGGGSFHLHWIAREDKKIENWEPLKGMLAYFNLIPKPYISPSIKKPKTGK